MPKFKSGDEIICTENYPLTEGSKETFFHKGLILNVINIDSLQNYYLEPLDNLKIAYGNHTYNYRPGLGCYIPVDNIDKCFRKTNEIVIIPKSRLDLIID
jgi:hypothetical protein